jgi:hypothetical protein
MNSISWSGDNAASVSGADMELERRCIADGQKWLLFWFLFLQAKTAIFHDSRFFFRSSYLSFLSFHACFSGYTTFSCFGCNLVCGMVLMAKVMGFFGVSFLIFPRRGGGAVLSFCKKLRFMFSFLSHLHYFSSARLLCSSIFHNSIRPFNSGILKYTSGNKCSRCAGTISREVLAQLSL